MRAEATPSRRNVILSSTALICANAMGLTAASGNTPGNRKMDLEAIWRIREAEVYPKLFGTKGRGIFTLSAELFTTRFRQKQIDPRWTFYGVFEFPPTASRPWWLYVTSGHSNPWGWDEDKRPGEPGKISGTGVEFLFASTQQGNWAIGYLQNMLALDLLERAGRLSSGRLIKAGDRIPLNSPLNGDPTCVLRNAVVSNAKALPSGFVLPSGRVEFLTFTGVTDAEIGFAKANSTATLIERLLAAKAYPITDPGRQSIL
jgi:hypothetical protein